MVGDASFTREELGKILSDLSDQEFSKLSPFFADLIKAERRGNNLDEQLFRQSLRLTPNVPVPDPTITRLTGIVLPRKNRTLKRRIAECDFYYANTAICENLCITQSAGPRSLWLAHFGVDLEGHLVKRWASRNGYGLAGIEDCLAVVSHKKYWDLPMQFRIVALGAYFGVHGRRRVPFVTRWEDKRQLLIHDWRFDFADCDRFLLVKLAS